MLETNFNPFPVLQSKRLVLRELNILDAPQMFLYRSSEDIMKYIGRPRAKTIEDAIQLIERMNGRTETGDGLNWGITLKESTQVIGSIGYVDFKKEHYRAEIGYLLATEYHGQGIMNEAIQCVLEYGFNILKLHSVEAITDPENKASIALLKKNKFIQEAHFKEDFYFEGKFSDSFIFSLLASTFNQV